MWLHKMMFTRCSTETRTLPLLLLKLLPEFYVSSTLKYFCTADCRTKILIKPQLLNFFVAKCTWPSSRSSAVLQVQFVIARIVLPPTKSFNCCLCHKAARNNAAVCSGESRTNTFSVMAASICMHTFYPSPHLNPCFLSFWFHLHFLHRIFLGIYDKRFSYIEQLPTSPWQIFHTKQSIAIYSQAVKIVSWFRILTFLYHPLRYSLLDLSWLIPTNRNETACLRSRFPHSPSLMQISVSWLKFCSSLSDVCCWRTCGMRSSFNNAVCAPKQSLYWIQNKLHIFVLVGVA